MKQTTLNRVIELVIEPNGNTLLTTRGFTGPECRAASHPFEQALGITSGEVLTGEYYRQASGTTIHTTQTP